MNWSFSFWDRVSCSPKFTAYQGWPHAPYLPPPTSQILAHGHAAMHWLNGIFSQLAARQLFFYEHWHLDWVLSVTSLRFLTAAVMLITSCLYCLYCIFISILTIQVVCFGDSLTITLADWWGEKGRKKEKKRKFPFFPFLLLLSDFIFIACI